MGQRRVPLAMAKRSCMRCNLLVCVLLLHHAVGVSAQAKDLELRGRLSVDHPDLPQANLTATFTVRLSGSRWSIRIDKAPPEEVAYDGTNVYGITLYGSMAGNESVNDSSAVIYERLNLPPPEYMTTFGVWFAYASSGFFQLETNRIGHILWIEPVWLLKGVTFPTIVEKIAASPSLPARVEIFSEGLLYSNQRRQQPTKLPPPYDRGYRMADYEAVELTNFGGWTLPRKFVWKQYRPGAGASSNDIGLALTSTGILEEATAVETTTVVPELASATLTLDHRFAADNPPAAELRYLNTNRVWLPKTSERLRSLHLAAARQQREANAALNIPERKWPLIGALALVLLLAAPIMVFAVRRVKQPRHR